MTRWPSVTLAEVATIERSVIQPEDISASDFYVGLENVARGGAFMNVGPAGAAGIASAKFRFTSRQVLFGKLRPYLAKIACPDFGGVCSTDILPITPGPDIDREYLRRFLELPTTIELATTRSTGANLPRLAPQELAKFSLPLPPLAQQRRIAEVLNRVDALRAKRRESVDLLDGLVESTFLDMFGSHEEWPRVTVNDLASEVKGSIRTGPFGSQLLHEEFVESGVPVLGIDNAVSNEFAWRERRYITEEKYRELARYRVNPGDVLITIMGTCGRCVVVPDDIPVAINTKHLCCITLDREKCLPEFLHGYFLMHPDSRKYLRQTAKGAIMAGLNMAIIKELPVALPPLDLQRVFAARVKSVKKVKAINLAHLAELDALFASLQHRAFRGELWPDSGAPGN